MSLAYLPDPPIQVTIINFLLLTQNVLLELADILAIKCEVVTVYRPRLYMMIMPMLEQGAYKYCCISMELPEGMSVSDCLNLALLGSVC